MPVSKAVVPSILEPGTAPALDRIQDLPGDLTLVEIRGDRMSAEDLAAAVSRTDRDVVVTIRRAGHGGFFPGSEEDRIRHLQAGLQAGATYVDLDIGTTAATDRRFRQEQLVLSWHGDGTDLRELQEVLSRMRSIGAARFKLVPRADHLSDLATIRGFLSGLPDEGTPVICFASGRYGPLSRLLALSWGSCWTFGFPCGGENTADGQFTVSELTEIYGVTSIGEATQRFGLIGSRLAGSPSPAMHNAALQDLGLNARYLPMEIDRFQDLAILADPAGPVCSDGFGVTMPFKEEAAALAVELDPDGAAAGAVNTLVPAPGGWKGFNTDASAMRRLLNPALLEAGCRAVVYGAGGTARTAAVVLRQQGAEVHLVGRRPDRVRQVAGELGVGAIAGWTSAPPAHVLVNATPYGREGESWPARRRLPSKLVLDAPYGRSETDLVRKARQAGVVAVSGREMILAQAMDQFRLLTGRHPRREVMSDALERWFARDPA